MRLRILTLVATTVAAVLVGSAPAHASSGAQHFAEQAKAAHLSNAEASELQLEVDSYLKRVGGKQTALNKIEFPGGEILVALPGEDRARELRASSTTQLMSFDPCFDDMYTGYFCAWTQTGYSGTVMKLYYCGTYNMPWGGTGSWINNQTDNTYARFYGSSGNLLNSNQAYASAVSYNWLPIFKIRICG